MTAGTKTFDISNNTFAAIIFGREFTNYNQKAIAVADELTFQPSRSNGENMERQQEFEAFTKYLRSEYERLGEDLKDLTNMDMSLAMDVNHNMQGIYEILNDACTAASAANRQEYDRLAVSQNGESALQQCVRENKKKAIGEHISAISSCAIDVMTDYANVIKQSVGISADMSAQSSMDRADARSAAKAKASTPGTSGPVLPQEVLNAISAVKRRARPAAAPGA